MKDESVILFEIFPWKSDFETGIKLIDEQHKEIVRIINLIATHLVDRSSYLILDKLFNELDAYIEYHFKAEDEIWLEHFKDDEWHTRQSQMHNGFKEKIVLFKEDRDKKLLADRLQEIVTYLTHWLVQHILDLDKRMGFAIDAIRSGHTLQEAKKLADEKISDSTTLLIQSALALYDNLASRTMDLLREKSLRKQAEEALIRSEERWKFMLDGGAENVWDWDIEHDKILQSEHEAPVFEMTGATLKNGKGDFIIHPDDMLQLDADFQDHLKGKTDFFINKHRIIRKNGSWGWVLSRGKVICRSEEGMALRMVGAHSDITEREVASLIYKSSSQAIFLCDANRRIISVNPSFTKITGYEEDEVIGKNPKFLASGKQERAFYEKMQEALYTSGYWSGKIHNRRKSGEIYIESLEITLIRDSDGNISHFFALFDDITEAYNNKIEHEKQKEQLLQQSRMAQMGEMISMIAHQWRQPLGAIASTSIDLNMQIELNRFDIEEEEGRKACQTYFSEGLKEIDGFVQSLTTTIDDFRNFYKPDKQFDVVMIHEPISKALNMMKASLASDGIEIAYNNLCGGEVKIHSNELVQVILNILKNAQDNFTEKSIINPKITITCRCSIYDEAIIEISDNGGGIPEDILPKIFDPYFSTKSEKNGTGLGLYMSKIIIAEHHKGSLHVSNRKDGVCFTITLPRIKRKTSCKDITLPR